MKIHPGYKNVRLKDPVVTLGIFDGVHKGHRMLLNELIKQAGDLKGTAVVITFHPHPRLVLDRGAADLQFLSTMKEKRRLLDRYGIDDLIVIEFTQEFSKIKACEFVENILAGQIGAKSLVVGHDHHFGHKGEGNFEIIKECAGRLGIGVVRVKGFEESGRTISSSIIRDALLSGRLSDANRWLGYDYSMSGTVIEGKRIGRGIGFPTANIKPSDPNKLIPAIGVYAVNTIIDNLKYPGMLSIGTNPTINESRSTSVEVNIFNFERDIYGSEIEVVFRHRLRDEKKFASTKELAEQMRLDKEDAMKLLE